MSAARFHRDGRGGLAMAFADETEPAAVVAVLKSLGAAFGEQQEDPLGDEKWVELEVTGARLELSSHYACGLTLAALDPAAEGILRQVAERLGLEPEGLS